MQIEKNADKLEKTLKVLIKDAPGYLGKFCTAIGQEGGRVGEIETGSLGLTPNTGAIVTNGTAILGLGAIGPVAGMPVMEGKAVLLDRLAGVNGVPILLEDRGVDHFVEVVKAIAPTFGAINLEDVAAPDCFEIERRLDGGLGIPGG